MTILNLSGNFHPPTPVDSGKNLPPLSSRAPSTNSEPGLKEASKVEQKIVENTVDDIQATIDNFQQAATKETVEDPIEELQQFNQDLNRSLQFTVDEELGVTVVRVVDKDTDELIRQFPPEELINLSRRLKELNEQDSGKTGVLLREKV